MKVPSDPSSYPVYHFELFSANPTLGDSHTLDITADAANAFYLDYVLLQTDSAFITSVGCVDGCGGGGSSSSFTAISAVSSQTQTVGGDANAHRTSVGTIAGGAVGGIVALAAVSFAVFVLLRKKRRSATISIDGGPDGGMYMDVENPNASPVQERHPATIYQHVRSDSGESSLFVHPSRHRYLRLVLLIFMS